MKRDIVCILLPSEIHLRGCLEISLTVGRRLFPRRIRVSSHDGSQVGSGPCRASGSHVPGRGGDSVIAVSLCAREDSAQKKSGRLSGERQPVLAKSSGEEGKLVYIDGGFAVFAADGCCAGVSPWVFVIRRTSTRRFLARPCAVLLLSTGLSLPNPTT